MKNNLKLIFIMLSVVVLVSCASLPSDFVAEPSYAITDTSETTLGVKAKKTLGNRPDQSALTLINEGTDAFLTRMLLLSMAESTVDVQYFIWKSDLIGKMLFNGMLEAADRGVRVRILLDDLTLDGETRKTLFALDQHKNINVRIYNPFSDSGSKFAAAVTDTTRINRRMHNKSFNVDGQYTVVGGRNIETNYFSANTRSNYSDLDIVAAGPVVKEVDKQFDIYWNSQLAVPAHVFTDNNATSAELDLLRKELLRFADKNSQSEYALDIHNTTVYKRISRGIAGVDNKDIYRGKTEVVYDAPDKTLGKSHEETVYLATLMQKHIEGIENTFELVSPYFIPDAAAIKYFKRMVDRGVNVKVVTNSLASTDGIMAQSGYARHRIELLKSGVKLYELKPSAKTEASRSLKRSARAKSALHAKTYIFDRKKVYIGSFNFDPRSTRINTELGVVCEIPEMAEFIAKNIFDQYLKDKTYQVKLITSVEDVEDDTEEYVSMPVEKLVWIEILNGKEVRYTEQPETSVWRRFNLNFYSILPIESLL